VPGVAAAHASFAATKITDKAACGTCPDRLAHVAPARSTDRAEVTTAKRQIQFSTTADHIIRPVTQERPIQNNIPATWKILNVFKFTTQSETRDLLHLVFNLENYMLQCNAFVKPADTFNRTWNFNSTQSDAVLQSINHNSPTSGLESDIFK
jgi:hypothetical protein